MDFTICRLCGDHKPPSVITASITDLYICSQLEILKINLTTKTNLPTAVCPDCLHNLEICSNFTKRILSVQEQLDGQFSATNDGDFEHFELKIEKLDTGSIIIERFEANDQELEDNRVEFDEKVVTRRPRKSKSDQKSTHKTELKTIQNARKRVKPEPNLIPKMKNRGIKMARDALKHTMQDLFSQELQEGKFTAQIDQLQVPSLDPNLGWFNYEWKCTNGCQKPFENVMDLEKHSLKCTRKRCTNSCTPCEKVFPSYATYLNHLVDRHQPLLKFSCLICSKFHMNLMDLYRHMTSCHGDYSVFFCLYCGKFFFTGAVLRDHLVSHRPGIKLPQFICDICGYENWQKHRMMGHMNQVHTERKYTCEFCASSFKHRSELVQHVAEHDEGSFEECKICGKKLKTKRKLRRHMRNLHEAPGISCEICGKVSKTRMCHKSHMKIHSNQDVYQCTFCPRTFKHNSGFKYHLRIHTGEKPYACPICELKFIDWPNCKKHIKSSHGVDDAKPVVVGK